MNQTNEGVRYFEHDKQFESDQNNWELLQALEYDADAYSVGLILGFALKNKELFYPFENLKDHEIAIYFCIALCLLYHCLDLYSSNGNLKTSSSHPIPGVRLAYSYLTICGYLENLNTHLLEALPAIFVSCYADIAEYWYIIGLPRKSHEFDFRSMADVGMEIKLKQKQLRKDILRELCLKRRNNLNRKS